MTVTQVIHSCNTSLLSQLRLSRAGVPWFPAGAMVVVDGHICLVYQIWKVSGKVNKTNK